MSQQAKHRFAAHLRDFAAIDAGAGVIRGVSVITEGPALGHGMEVDATTLAQVKACAETYAGGLKVKISTQRGHLGDVAEIVGYLTGFRIEGAKLLADLHLLETSPHRAYILELAAKIPDTFGLSISFSGPVERVDEVDFARCVEIYSADLVAEPAANPTGLFSVAEADTAPAKLNNQTKMEDQKQPDPIADLKALFEQLSARLSKLENPTPPAEEKKEDMSAKLTQAAELGAQAALKQFAATFGAPPAAASAPKEQAPAAKTFEALVREHPEYSKNRANAIRECVTKYAKEYADYNTRLRSKADVIIF